MKDAANANKTVPPTALNYRRLGNFILIAALFVGFMATLGAYFGGLLCAQKVLTKMSLPLGLLWIGLTAWVLTTFWERRWLNGLLLTLTWCVYTACGTAPMVDLCLNTLEKQVQAYDATTVGKLDALIVLGGGTSVGPFRAQANSQGDRVLYAAQLYLQGHVERLVTTGTAMPGVTAGKRSDPQEMTIEIWRDLTIADEAILQLPGRNTSEEMESTRELVSAHPDWKIGLLSSAFHLPRAIRLAKANGLELIPIAADYRANQEPYTFDDAFIPQAKYFDLLRYCQHEWMAGLFSR